MVTGVGAPVGMSIITALREASLPVRIVAADSEPMAQGLFLADGAHQLPSCREDPDAYFEALVSISRREGAQILLSGWEGELPLLATRKAEFERRTGAVLPMVPAATLKALDKWETYKVLAKAGVGVPDTVLPGDQEGMAAFRRRNAFPYIVKPRRGWGGQGLFLVKSEEELAYFSRYVKDAIVQEYLQPAEREYSSGVFLKEGGVAAGVLPLRRMLAGGVSYRMESDANPEVISASARAAEALGLIGPANVQLRITPGGPKVFEVNPRCSGGTCVRARFGLNEPEWTIRRFVLGEELPPLSIREGFCLRYWAEMYLSPAAGAEARQGTYEPVALS